MFNVVPSILVVVAFKLVVVPAIVDVPAVKVSVPVLAVVPPFATILDVVMVSFAVLVLKLKLNVVAGEKGIHSITAEKIRMDVFVIFVNELVTYKRLFPNWSFKILTGANTAQSVVFLNVVDASVKLIVVVAPCTTSSKAVVNPIAEEVKLAKMLDAVSRIVVVAALIYASVGSILILEPQVMSIAVDPKIYVIIPFTRASADPSPKAMVETPFETIAPPVITKLPKK